MTELYKLNHQERFELEGTWWLVGKARQKVTGTLEYDPERGIHLDLDGDFSRQSPDQAMAALLRVKL